MSGIDWAAAEDALKAAVAASLTVLEPGMKVYWFDELADPHSVPPPGAVLDLELLPADQSDREDEYDPDAPAGEEVTATTSQAWQATLLVEIHAQRQGTTGSRSGRALAAQLLTDLQNPVALDALFAAGLGFTDILGVVGKRYQTADGFRPSTVASARFYASTETASRGGYVDKFRLVSSSPSETVTLDLSQPQEAP